MTALILPDPNARVSRWTVLACAPLLICLTLYCVAYLANRWEPVDTTVLWLLLAPLGWLVATPPAARFDRGQQAVVLVVLTLIAWMATLQVALPHAYPSGWWRVAERCAYLSAFVLILATRPATALAMRAFGAAAAVTVTGALAVNLANDCFGPGETRCFGFGHINILANTTGPALIAWCTWLAYSRGRDRVAWGSWALAAIGVACLAAIAIGTQRRGVPLALGAALFTLLTLRLLAWRRPIGLVVIALPLLLVTPRLMSMFTVDVPNLRDERIALYRAGFDGAVASFPFGLGHYGAKQLSEVDGEHARHLIATGSWGYHIHNEPLDILLDGGIPAFALAASIIVLSVLRLRHLADPRARQAFAAMGAAVLVHAMTDNVYGTEVGQAWLAAGLGLLWSAPVCNPATGARWFPSLRFIQWPLVLISCWGATHAIYPAVLHREAYPSVRYQCLQQALNPQTINSAALQMLLESDPPIDVADRRAVIMEAVRQVGWTGVLAAQDPDLIVDPSQPELAAAALLRLLGYSEFNKTAYQGLLTLAESHPQVRAMIPERVQRRLPYLAGTPGLPRPDLSFDPLNIDAAADLYAAIIWSITIGSPWSEVERPLWNLCRRYGDIPDVTMLVLEVLTEAPPDSLPWIGLAAPILEVGMRYVPAGILPTLNKVHSVDQAIAVMPLLRMLYPGPLQDIDEGRIRNLNGAMVDLHLEFVRIHRLVRTSIKHPPGSVP